MRVLKITPIDGYEVTDIPDRLETLQEAVGGLIEVVWLTPRMVMIINEEDKLIEEMRAEKPSEKENEPASAATEHKPITSKMEERHTLSIPQNDNSCQDLIDEVIKDLVKISNWCCTEGDEPESDYVHTLGFIQGFTEALADKYRGYRHV